MVDFAALRGNAKNGLDAVNDLAKKMGQKKDYHDERVWKPTWKEVSKGEFVSENIIRFMPASFIDMSAVEKGELEIASPIVTIKKHFFKCAKGFYVENSLSTFGEDCPVSAHDIPLWKQWKDEGKPDDQRKKTLMNRIAKDEKYCNILVIMDKNCPENNGKVFLYKVGVSIYEKIENAAKPKFAGVEPFDAFNVFTGANMLLNLSGKKQKGGFGDYIKPNFDEVKWGTPGKLFEDDELIEKAGKECYSLAEIVDRKNFKTYDELEEIFFKKMGYDVAGKEKTESSGAQQKSLSDYQSETQNTETPKTDVDNEDGDVGHSESTAEVSSDLTDFEKMLQQGE